jgi:hypothetical protein
MLQGNKLKLQCGATAKTQGNDRNNGRENRQHFLTVRSARENHHPLSALWRVLSKDKQKKPPWGNGERTRLSLDALFRNGMV